MARDFEQVDPPWDWDTMPVGTRAFLFDGSYWERREENWYRPGGMQLAYPPPSIYIYRVMVPAKKQPK